MEFNNWSEKWLKRLDDSLQSIETAVVFAEREFKDVLTAGDYRIRLGKDRYIKVKERLAACQNRVTAMVKMLDENHEVGS